ncbi:hypothetical protein SDC9_09377 [bioreactor metagenome]|uniref:Uncharacterized protein n=1 Tax=bioreactor metagenome TaxID=1076179 RepID=A0A644T9W4_9ZZZZ|nr:hypothetical protein [Desulfitobacterium hafniense]MEA5024267.1 hypothetical protein [Desulfitobacterium hafniense]
MANYSEMYHILFNKITDIIEELQDVQRQTEEMYLQCQKHETIALKVYNINQSKHVGDTIKNTEKRPLR